MSAREFPHLSAFLVLLGLLVTGLFTASHAAQVKRGTAPQSNLAFGHVQLTSVPATAVQLANVEAALSSAAGTSAGSVRLCGVSSLDGVAVFAVSSSDGSAAGSASTLVSAINGGSASASFTAGSAQLSPALPAVQGIAPNTAASPGGKKKSNSTVIIVAVVVVCIVVILALALLVYFCVLSPSPAPAASRSHQMQQFTRSGA